MPFCSKCGAKFDEGTKFCPSCGASANASNQNNGAKTDFSDKFAEFNNTADTTTQFDSNDIDNNKAMGVLAYLSWLVLIPLFAADKSKFARFHVNQGLVLAIVELIWWVIETVLTIVFGFIPVVGAIVAFVLSIPNILFLVLAIIGIVNAVNGKAKELPIIGKYKVIK